MSQWWGYSKEHGWVVLDRNIPANIPGIKTDLVFLRCRDATTYVEKREKWIVPAYQFAPNYVRSLTPPANDMAAAELESIQSRWPDFEREIQRVWREGEERIENARAEEEKVRKAATRKARQAVAAKA